MLSRGEGRIVDVASVTGTTAWPLVSATSLAKTALIRRVETLAAACGDRGLKAFAVHPGVVRTELLLSYTSHPGMAAFLENAPEEVFSPPEAAARVVARIAAGEFDSLSGRFVDATTDLGALCARDLARTRSCFASSSPDGNSSRRAISALRSRATHEVRSTDP
jgi:NAD(P)-dependent dehydrogenase (short-subunit alcohol dehydrogenase family)